MGSPRGWAGAKHHVKTLRQTGERATQPLHLFTGETHCCPQNRVTFSAPNLLHSDAPAFVSRERRGGWRRYIRNLVDLSNGERAHRNCCCWWWWWLWWAGGGWQGVGGWGGHHFCRRSWSGPIGIVAAVSRAISSRQTPRLRPHATPEVRQCRPPPEKKNPKKHLCFHFYVVILMKKKKKIPSWSAGTGAIAASTAQSQKVFPPTLCQGLKVEERHSSLSSPPTNETDWFKIRSRSNSVFCWRLARWTCEISEWKRQTGSDRRVICVSVCVFFLVGVDCEWLCSKYSGRAVFPLMNADWEAVPCLCSVFSRCPGIKCRSRYGTLVARHH